MANNKKMPIVAICAGEPAGIGPDIVLHLPGAHDGIRQVIIGNKALLEKRAAKLQLTPRWADYKIEHTPPAGTVEILSLPLVTEVKPGQLNPANVPYVLSLLDRALAGCTSQEFCAMVTAPVHKGVINEYGIPFSGHTEYLAEKTQTPRVVMMLVGGGLRVALASTHLPLRAVPDALTPTMLQDVITILHHDLITRFHLPQPTILVAGLNPHAGEGGYLGREEIDIITPVITALRAQGMKLDGPHPADTLFNPERLAHCDAVLAMYHDQGLPVLKFASFGQGVNITLGLPLIRTSVDHGTALELAGSKKASAESLLAAVKLAETLST